MPHIKGKSVIELLKAHDPTDAGFEGLMVRNPAAAVTGLMGSINSGSSASAGAASSLAAAVPSAPTTATGIKAIPGPDTVEGSYYQPSTASSVGRVLAIGAMACIPVFGWAYLWARYQLVKPGEVGMCQDMNGNVEIYGPGRHLVLSFYSHLQVFSLAAENIQYKVDPADPQSQCQIITIKPGEIGVGRDQAKPTILMPGVHFIKSKTFIYEKAYKTTDAVIEFSGGMLLTVNHNQCRRVMANGKMEILTEGCYKLMGAYTVDPNPIPLTKQEIEIEVKNQSTQDKASITQRAHVNFTITDPTRLFEKFARLSDVLTHIKNRAEASLGQIINNITIGDYHKVAEAASASGSSEVKSAVPAPTPKRSLREEMAHNLREGLVSELQPLGITLERVAPDETILDPTLQSVLNAQAAANIKLASERQTLEGRIGLKTAEAEADARVEMIKKENEAKVKELEHKTKAHEITSRAEADASGVQKGADAQLYAHQKLVEAGKALEGNPVATQLALAAQMTGALSKANITLVGSDISTAAAGLLFRAAPQPPAALTAAPR